MLEDMWQKYPPLGELTLNRLRGISIVQIFIASGSSYLRNSTDAMAFVVINGVYIIGIYNPGSNEGT